MSRRVRDYSGVMKSAGRSRSMPIGHFLNHNPTDGIFIHIDGAVGAMIDDSMFSSRLIRVMFGLASIFHVAVEMNMNIANEYQSIDNNRHRFLAASVMP